MEEQKNMRAIGREILDTARNELYLNLPYLDTALCAFRFLPGEELTDFVATDGTDICYNPNYLAERYLRGRTTVNRIFLHMVLHCLLRHLGKKRGKEPALWDLACDVAVESILDGMDYPCLAGGTAPSRQILYRELGREMPVLTAEGVYRHFLRQQPPEYELARLQRAFFQDDHVLWDGENENGQEKQWEQTAQRTQTSLETVLAGQATGGEAVYEQVKVANRERVDYRAFLRRFALPREVMAVDGDAFDYGFYAYGLRLYGNMPLVEPLETREEKRVEDLVIAVDTSLSTSGELVREFLSATYAILRSSQSFSHKVNIHILQCDDQIRSDTVIHTLKDLETLMEDFQLSGGSATDFRPVFDYVGQLRQQGAFSRLRGLIYFTDGIGTYPKKRPPYDVAFVMMETPVISVDVPPWAIRLSLTEEELGEALHQSMQQGEETAT